MPVGLLHFILLFLYTCWWQHSCREGGVGGLATPGPAMFGAPPSTRNIKYARMYHFEKKNSKKFLPRGALQNVWRPRENVSSGPTVALDRPDKARSQISTFSWLRDQPFLNCKWRYYVKSAPYAVGGSTFLCYLIELATGYCWSTVLYLALFGTTLQSHFMKGFCHRPTSDSLQMLHETWSLIAIFRGHNDPAPVKRSTNVSWAVCRFAILYVTALPI